jgi:hypothetical protein
MLLGNIFRGKIGSRMLPRSEQLSEIAASSERRIKSEKSENPRKKLARKRNVIKSHPRLDANRWEIFRPRQHSDEARTTTVQGEQ